MRFLSLLLTGCALAGCAGTESSSGAPGSETTAQNTAGDEAASSGAAEKELGLPNEAHPAPGLTTGGQPSDEALARAKAEGYSTVISLRTEGEPGSEGEAERVRELGMRYVSMPVGGPDDLTEDKARALEEALQRDDGPVLLHCGSGNRAGSLVALHAFNVEGASIDEAMERGREAGMTRLSDAVREHLRQACEDDPERSC
jgi:uncharacterized protein (TIGR01244 family)